MYNGLLIFCQILGQFWQLVNLPLYESGLEHSTWPYPIIRDSFMPCKLSQIEQVVSVYNLSLYEGISVHTLIVNIQPTRFFNHMSHFASITKEINKLWWYSKNIAHFTKVLILHLLTIRTCKIISTCGGIFVTVKSLFNCFNTCPWKDGWSILHVELSR